VGVCWGWCICTYSFLLLLLLLLFLLFARSKLGVFIVAGVWMHACSAEVGRDQSEAQTYTRPQLMMVGCTLLYNVPYSILDGLPSWRISPYRRLDKFTMLKRLILLTRICLVIASDFLRIYPSFSPLTNKSYHAFTSTWIHN